MRGEQGPQPLLTRCQHVLHDGVQRRYLAQPGCALCDRLAHLRPQGLQPQLHLLLQVQIAWRMGGEIRLHRRIGLFYGRVVRPGPQRFGCSGPGGQLIFEIGPNLRYQAGECRHVQHHGWALCTGCLRWQGLDRVQRPAEPDGVHGSQPLAQLLCHIGGLDGWRRTPGPLAGFPRPLLEQDHKGELLSRGCWVIPRRLCTGVGTAEREGPAARAGGNESP